MKLNGLFKGAMILLLTMLFQTTVFAQKDPIAGLWMNEEGTGKVKIYKAKNKKFYGKIVWLKEPIRDGKERVDEHNPDKSKQSQPLMNLLILKSFEKDGDDEYEDGTIYDPKNGKTYSCVMTLEGDKLDVRGYVGISWIGRTTTWTRVKE